MPVIETESTSCLVRLHSHSECRRCQDVCPASAITLDGGRVIVDQALCIGCGLCLSACPTSVFSVRGLDLAALLDNGVGRDGDTLTLSCACTSAQGCDPSASSSRVLPCLGMLDDDLLLALAGKGVKTLVLRTGDGEACVLHARDIIGSTIERVRKRWPGRLAVEMHEEHSIPDASFAQTLDELVPPKEETLDRRAFLMGIVERARDAVSDPPAVEEKEWGPRPLPAKIPARRELLLASVLDTDPVVFPRLAISDACDDCQEAHSLCSRFCPSGALSRVETDTKVEFIFKPEICVDCGQCSFVCPQDAISSQAEEPGRDARTLRVFERGVCTQCGKTASYLTEGLCPACSRNSSLKNTLLDWVLQPKTSAESPQQQGEGSPL